MSISVNLDDLVAGMVLAEDAVHLNGRVLLCTGACLTDKHLNMFRTWGLNEAQIKGEAGEEVSDKGFQAMNPEIVLRAKQAMKKSFEHVDLNFEPAAELFRICVQTHAERLSNGVVDESNS